MGRFASTAAIRTRTARRKLTPRPYPYWDRVPGDGLLSLGYERRPVVPVRWIARLRRDGAFIQHVLGLADDDAPADGHAVLSYTQACAAVRDWAESLPVAGAEPTQALSVRGGVESYLAAREARKGERSATAARSSLNHVLRSPLADVVVAELTKDDLLSWRDGVVTAIADKSIARDEDLDPTEATRRAQDTANRVASDLKAALTQAFESHDEVESDKAWRTFRPFKDVGRPRAVSFTEAELGQLAAAARHVCPQFGNLVTAGALTGSRYGELANANVRDLDAKRGVLHVVGKTGARDVILQAEALEFFKALTEERPAGDPLLVTPEGGRWAAGMQHRRFKAVLTKAKLDRDGACFYSLRHSFATHAIETGTPPGIVATNMGTSEAMLRRTYAKVIAAHRRPHIEHAAPRLSLIPGRRAA